LARHLGPGTDVDSWSLNLEVLGSPFRKQLLPLLGSQKVGRQRVKVVILKFGDDEAKPPDPQQKADAKAGIRSVRAQENAAPPK
jgi:hypothetical protein